MAALELLRPSVWLSADSARAGEALDVAAASVALVLLVELAVDAIGVEVLWGWLAALPSPRGVVASPLLVVFGVHFLIHAVGNTMVASLGMALVESVLFWGLLCAIGWTKLAIARTSD
jgi:hypothetical protein